MIIYPQYIDQKLCKKNGRRISKKNAVDSPKAQEILKALERIGEGDASLEKDAAYTRMPWDKSGRVILERKSGKTGILKLIAKEIKRMRTP